MMMAITITISGWWSELQERSNDGCWSCWARSWAGAPAALVPDDIQTVWYFYLLRCSHPRLHGPHCARVLAVVRIYRTRPTANVDGSLPVLFWRSGTVGAPTRVVALKGTTSSMRLFPFVAYHTAHTCSRSRSNPAGLCFLCSAGQVRCAALGGEGDAGAPSASGGLTSDNRRCSARLLLLSGASASGDFHLVACLLVLLQPAPDHHP